MKWSLDAYDKHEQRWYVETVIAEKCFIAGSGVISFLDTEKTEVVPPIIGATEPELPTLVPKRVGFNKKRPGSRVMKVKVKQIPVRAFPAGDWTNLQLMRQL